MNYSNMRVLIVDDVQLHPMVLGKVLRKFGCRPDSAQNGAEALEKLKGRKFDLIFMDCNMPEMNGFTTTQAIREGDPDIVGNPIIIALTSDTMNVDRDKCLKVGMNDFLPKPFTPEQVGILLEKWVK